MVSPVRTRRAVQAEALAGPAVPAWPVRLWSVTPGITLSLLAAAFAMVVNSRFPTVSPLLIAMIIGAIVANSSVLSDRFRPGLQIAAKRLLRAGVALLGLQLMLGDITRLGGGVIAVVVAVVGLGITGTMYIGKLLGLSWAQRIFIACGFSICGAAAVAAVDGVVDSKDDEDVVTGVALVVIFGTLMIPLVPLLSSLIGLSSTQAGLWAGASIHEVAQVVAAAGAIGGSALGVAVVVKLARVLMLAPVMAILSVRQRRILGADAEIERPPLVPLFVVVFMICVLVRSSGAVPGGVLDAAKLVQTAALSAAMFALGTGVHFSIFKKVGVRPFVLATVSTVWVSAIALAGILLVG